MKLSFSPEEQLQLEELGIEAVILFGSQAQNATNPASDYDIGVITATKSDHKTAYSLLYDLISAKINQLVDIDIVFMDQAPGELLSHVAKYGVVLYQVTPNTFAKFREKVINLYADFAPLRAIFSNATLSRISS